MTRTGTIVSADGSQIAYPRHTLTRSFGVRDRYGRLVGGLAAVYEVPAYRAVRFGGAAGAAGIVDVPARIHSRIYSLRDGKQYGAIPRDMEHATLEEAMASAEKRLERSRRRQVEQFGEEPQ